MRHIRKIVFWAAIITAILLLLAPLLLKALHLEFASSDDELTFESVRFFSVPVAALFSLIVTIKKGDSKANIIGKVVVTLIPVFVFVAVINATLLDWLCFRSTDKILFINLADTSIKIASRDYGCGSFDREMPIYHTVKVKYYTQYLIKAWPIDTTGIDKSRWFSVEDVQP